MTVSIAYIKQIILDINADKREAVKHNNSYEILRCDKALTIAYQILKAKIKEGI